MFAEIFASVLLPLVIVCGAAYLLGRRGHINPQPLARTSFYLFNPSLAFVTMASTTIPQHLLGRLALLKLLVYIVLIPLTLVVAGRLGLSGPLTSAFMLASIFSNSGNYGLSVTEFAFGQAGLALAVISYLIDNAMMNSLGVYIAARGRADIRQAARQVLANPALYAVPLGLLVNRFDWTVPLPLYRAVEMMGRAAIPTMLAVLGLQLAMLPLNARHLRVIGASATLRLVVAPVVALVLTVPLGLTELARQIGVLQAAVPTAVTTGILASRYDTEPNLVAGSILVSSLGSLVTITLLLSLLK